MRYDSVPSNSFRGEPTTESKTPMFRQYSRNASVPSDDFYEEPTMKITNPMAEQFSTNEIIQETNFDDQTKFGMIKQITRQFIEIPSVMKLPDRLPLELNADLSVYINHYDLPSIVYVSTFNDRIRSKFLIEKLINLENRFQSDSGEFSEKFVTLLRK